jgi:hypothetical protein
VFAFVLKHLADAKRELLDGKLEIAEFCVPHVGRMTLHADLVAAKSTIAKIRILEQDSGVRTVLAHDASWLVEGSDDVLMSLLDTGMREARDRVAKGEIP